AIVKDLGKMSEESKTAIRNIRRDALEGFKALKKKSEITEDDLKNAEKEIQNLTDKFCKEIDAMRAAKEKEILSV
ncbi:MAG: ribosome recycling factor, partial [Clostridia bacterium]|nr:ribosome recycling factor [Clostridia bacterium]